MSDAQNKALSEPAEAFPETGDSGKVAKHYGGRPKGDVDLQMDYRLRGASLGLASCWSQTESRDGDGNAPLLDRFAD